MRIGKCSFCGWVRRSILQKVCGEFLFNSDMSLEIDQLLALSERQQHRIQYLEGFLATVDGIELDRGLL